PRSIPETISTPPFRTAVPPSVPADKTSMPPLLTVVSVAEPPDRTSVPPLLTVAPSTVPLTLTSTLPPLLIVVPMALPSLLTSRGTRSLAVYRLSRKPEKIYLWPPIARVPPLAPVNAAVTSVPFRARVPPLRTVTLADPPPITSSLPAPTVVSPAEAP